MAGDKNKRKARRDKAKEVDLLKPVPMELLGSDNDPCFGKLNDPRHPTCMKCGDIEICAIAMGQLNHIKRALEEKKRDFKDLEEKDIPPGDKKKQKLEIKARIKEMIKQGKITKEEIIKDVYGKWMVLGWKQPRLEKIFDIVVKKNKSHITIKNEKYSWNNSA